MRSNCLIWALVRWWRHGGYIVVRRSYWGPFPHFLWSRDLKRFWSYQPVSPRHKKFPPPFFRGEVKEGDE